MSTSVYVSVGCTPEEALARLGRKGDALKVINTSQLISGQGATLRILRSTCLLIALAEVGPPGEVKYLLASQVIPAEELESLKPSPKEG